MTAKKIRPLRAYKNQNPEFWEAHEKYHIPHLKGKSRDNDIYWSLGFWNYWDKEYSETNPEPFFWKNESQKNNIMTVIEMGQLYLKCWYYGIESLGQNVARYIKRAYYRKTEAGHQFNDSEFSEAVRHIRDNIGYYYHNEKELKLYILEKFFNEELKPMLPDPPQILKDLEKGRERIKKLEKAWKKKDPNYFENRMYFLEEYVMHLTERLDECYISYYTEQQFTKIRNKEINEIAQEIRKAEQQHKASIINQLDTNKQLTQILR